MKRMVMVVAVLVIGATMSLVQAQSEGRVSFMANIDKLGTYLNLAPYQKMNVADINANFIELQRKNLGNEACLQEVEMQKLVYDNLREMKKVLTEAQYRKYVVLVNVTNNNNREFGGVTLSDTYMVNNR